MDERLAELLDRFANPDDGREPITGPHSFAEVAGPVTSLRRRIYSQSAPHLLGPQVQEIERALAIDESSSHLCAWADDQTLRAALRLSSSPIELPALSERCAQLVHEHARFGEISRVLTAPGQHRFDVVTRLFAAMVRHSLAEGATVGVMGVCRRRVVRFYARFGMTAVHDDPLQILGRDHDDYFVVAGTFEHMVEKGMYRLVEDNSTDAVGPT